MKTGTSETTELKTSSSLRMDQNIKNTIMETEIQRTSKTTRDKRVFYGSSYDRGLEHLLKMWPDVRKAVPNAELHIYYGWKLFDRFYGDNPERMAWKEKMEKMMAHEGITHHGRVSQPEIIKEMKMCGIWAYSTHFGEINCISAQKAQALGCIPVVIDYAALETTVQYGAKVEGDIYDKEVFDEFKAQLIALLKDPKRQEEIRKKMVPWARKQFTWVNTAKQWSDMFKGKEVKPLIPKI